MQPYQGCPEEYGDGDDVHVVVVGDNYYAGRGNSRDHIFLAFELRKEQVFARVALTHLDNALTSAFSLALVMLHINEHSPGLESELSDPAFLESFCSFFSSPAVLSDPSCPSSSPLIQLLTGTRCCCR